MHLCLTLGDHTLVGILGEILIRIVLQLSYKSHKNKALLSEIKFKVFFNTKKENFKKHQF